MTAASTTPRPRTVGPYATRLSASPPGTDASPETDAFVGRVAERCESIVAALRSDGYHAPEPPGLMERGIRLIHRDARLPTLSINMMRDPRHDRSDVPEIAEAAARALDPAVLTTGTRDLRAAALPIVVDALDAGTIAPDPRRWKVVVGMPTPWSEATLVERTSSAMASHLAVPARLADALPSLAVLTLIGQDLTRTDAWFLTPASVGFFGGADTDAMAILRTASEMRKE